MKKVSKKVLSLLLAVMILCSVFAAVPFTVSAETNFALQAEATADSVEAASLNASKLNDGDSTTRWASSTTGTSHWVQYHFSAPITVASASISWERNNVFAYTIDYSNDGSQWNTAYTFSNNNVNTQTLDGRTHTINFDSEVTASYFRVNITSFTDTAMDTAGTSVKWNTVSIFEFALYGEASGDIPLTLAQIAEQMEIPEITADMTAFPFPELDDDISIKINGSDYDAIIDKDGNLRAPLNTKNVAVSFTLTRGNESLTTGDRVVTVPGTFTATDESNQKPVVIPELAEWAGANGGEFTLANKPKLIVDEASYNALDDKEKAQYEVAKAEIIADFLEITGKTLTVEIGDITKASAGDIIAVFGTDDVAQLGEEGYKMDIDDVLTIEANTETGFYWATRSILQILKQTGGTIAKGLTYDYPQYPVRGFMLDVGRTPISMKTLNNIIKTMSWYKMNDFGVHLYDNFIWVENYTNAEDPYGAYAGFRLESDVKAGGNNGKNQADLTSTDLYYTKDEFRALIKDSRALGINVVPEFDAPAHSLSITQVRPDLSMTRGTVNRWADHLNLSNPESTQFVKDLWDEYMNGSDPVFDSDTIINIGSDEYNGNQNDFKNFVYAMLRYIAESGNTTRMWGSIKTNNVTDDVIPDDIDTSKVQTYLWSKGYADPVQMFNNGLGVIDILDGGNYIVPGANYYGDYLSGSAKYANYDPARELGLPKSDDKTLGGAYAIWNDYVDMYSNGMTDYDLFDRFYAPLVGYASQLWGDAQDMSYNDLTPYANVISTAPGTNPYNVVESKTDDKVAYDFKSEKITDSTGNGYNVTKLENAEVVNEQGKNALKLNGGASYAATPIDFFGDGAELSFSVYQETASTAGQILFETTDDFESWVINIQQDGTLGFSRENMNYTFGYTIPVGEWVDLKIVGLKDFAKLYVNGEHYATVGSSDRSNTTNLAVHATLMIPFARIGSATNAFEGLISNVSVYQEKPFVFSPNDPSIIDRSNFTITSDNENPRAGSEGPSTLAFDGDTSTFWHSNYTPYKALPASVTIDMQDVYTINAYTYIPRQDGSVNGIVTGYEIHTKLNESDEWTLVASGEWASTTDAKQVTFDSVEARYVKFTAVTGASNQTNQFASAAEMYVHNYVAPEYTLGDVNDDGSINAADAVIVLQYFAGIIDEINFDAANVNFDNAVNASDATLILQHFAGIIDTF